MKKFGTGQSVKRLEDPRLLKGQGKFTDDIRLEGEAVALVFRSTLAHAKINSIDLEDAREVDGVLAIYTATDIADELTFVPCGANIPGRHGTETIMPERPILAKDTVRYVGEPIAFIVAETMNAARDAADLIDVDFDMLDAVCEVTLAAAPDAVQLHASAPGNLSLDWEFGDEAAVADAIDKADKLVKLTVTNNRIVPNPMEPRSIVGQYHEDGGNFTLYAPSQGVWGIQMATAGMMVGVEPADIHVRTFDVGGGFGIKSIIYNEHPLVLFAARRLKRPVRWTADRIESFQCDAHGRDIVSHLTLAVTNEGRLLGYRVDSLSGFGAYCSHFGPFIPTAAAIKILGGVYNLPALYVNVKGIFSNTPPVDAYRGAGRPEANYMLERIMDVAAGQLGLSPAEFRRINMIKPEQLPYKNFSGFAFDSGNFPETMDMAVSLADYAGFEARKAEAASRGKLRGIGLAYYIECTIAGRGEQVKIIFKDNGRIDLYAGSQSNGQGHHTTFGQIVSEKLGVDLHLIDYVEGDTNAKDAGCGTGGSRSLHMVGSSTIKTADEIIAKGKRVMASEFDVTPDAVSFDDGIFSVEGSNHKRSIFEVHKMALSTAATDDSLVDGLSSAVLHDDTTSTYPNGCHVAEVEVDPKTGIVKLVDYSVVDDFGVLINPMIVKGQVHGGVVQGIGQALNEFCAYEEGSGQLLTGSFMDYGMPRADDIPDIRIEFNNYPCKTNPVGSKGCGEAGTIGALPSFANAVADAVKDYGINHIEMPYTPMKVWQLLNKEKVA